MEDSSWEKSWNQVDFLLPCFVSHTVFCYTQSTSINPVYVIFLVKSKFLRRPPSKLPRCQQQRQLGFWLWEWCVDCLPNPKTGTGKRKPWNPGICGWVTKLSYCTNLKLTRAQFVRSWNPWCDFPFWRIWNQQFEPPNIGRRHVADEETCFCFPSYKWENLGIRDSEYRTEMDTGKFLHFIYWVVLFWNIWPLPHKNGDLYPRKLWI